VERIEVFTPMHRLIAVAVLLVLMTGPSRADTVLYNGALNTTPDVQGWTYLTNPSPTQATQAAGSGVTTLDTTARKLDMAGYFSFGLPGVGTLDRTLGYTIGFRVRLAQESHVSNDRAGFSVIALSGDNQGIELGFWSNEVWAQNVGFTHGEGASFNTTASLTDYTLRILGSSYTLSANGSTLLTGPLRNYSAFGLPYNVPNLLVFGDDTTSASAHVEIARISLVPEPASWALAALGLAGAVVLRRTLKYKDFQI
jgi:hypothetical protein